jgi:hypothetical protein
MRRIAALFIPLVFTSPWRAESEELTLRISFQVTEQREEECKIPEKPVFETLVLPVNCIVEYDGARTCEVNWRSEIDRDSNSVFANVSAGTRTRTDNQKNTYLELEMRGQCSSEPYRVGVGSDNGEFSETVQLKGCNLKTSTKSYCSFLTVAGFKLPPV